MDWFKENKFLSGLLVIVVVGIVILGFLLFSARSEFIKTKQEVEMTSSKVGQLKSSKLFPNEENLALQEKEAETYAAAVDKLHTELLAYQRPLDRTVTDSGLQDLITEKVLDTKSRAARENITVADDYALGLNRYSSELPRLEAVPELHFSLQAADYLVSKLFDAGIDSIVSMEREPLASESVAAAEEEEPEEESFGDDEDLDSADGEAEEGAAERLPPVVVGTSGVVSRYPFKICFTSGADALENFLESVANTPEDTFLYNIRLLTFDNSAKEGPPRTSGSSRRRGSASEIAAEDSKVVLGAESVETCIWIDVLRLKEPGLEDEEDAGDPEEEDAA